MRDVEVGSGGEPSGTEAVGHPRHQFVVTPDCVCDICNIRCDRWGFCDPRNTSTFEVVVDYFDVRTDWSSTDGTVAAAAAATVPAGHYMVGNMHAGLWIH